MEAAILPGARVHAADTMVGSVERVELADPGATGRDAAGVLVVRAHDGARHYRVPLDLIAAVREERVGSIAYTVVRLAVDPAGLDRYAADDGLPHVAVIETGPSPIPTIETAPPPILATEDRPSPVPATKNEASSGPATGGGFPSIPAVELEGETVRVPVRAEELVVGTRPVQLGTVRLHKGVETGEQRLTVPLTREEVVVERIPADGFDATAPLDPGETIIPVVEERLVIETRAVVVAYVRVRKRRVTEQRDVRAPVRREVVTVEEQRAAGTDHPLVGE